MLHLSTKTKVQKSFATKGTSGYDEDGLRRQADEASQLVKQARPLLGSTSRKELMALKASYNAYAAKWNLTPLGRSTTLDRVPNAVIANGTSCVEFNIELLLYIAEWRAHLADVKDKSDRWADQYNYLKKCLAVCGETCMSQRELDCLLGLLPFDNQSDILNYLPDGYDYPEV